MLKYASSVVSGVVRLQKDLAWTVQELVEHGMTLREDRPTLSQGQAVILFPGFMAPEWTMEPLRRFLNGHGFVAEHWGLGQNLGFRKGTDPEELTEPFLEKIKGLNDATGQPVVLIGHSLGGVFAREAAKRCDPALVDRVITLGSPAYINADTINHINPSLIAMFRMITGHSRKDILNEIVTQYRPHDLPDVPLYCLWSYQDEVALPDVVRIPIGQETATQKNFRVRASHCGMVVCPATLQIILNMIQHGQAEPVPEHSGAAEIIDFEPASA